jgi:hypothetical protein
MSKLPFIALTLFAAGGAIGFVGCGSDDEPAVPIGTEDGGDGGGGDQDGDVGTIDGSRADTADCKAESAACTASTECCTANCAGGVCAKPLTQCKAPGVACTSGTECCTFSCIGGTCSNKQCVADNLACGTNADCCGGTCAPDGKGGGLCKPLSTTCRTSGNPCTTGDQCCSKLCNAGVCSDGVSFCTQTGDVCAENGDCCGGNCTKAAGAALGTCGETAGAPGATECLSKGSICGTVASGAPDCGGTCCSRICAPSGSAGGFMICQPPSGCSPTGELCKTDGDCCGANGSPPPVEGPVTCSKADPKQEYGRCDNGMSCREPGSICKPSNESCSAENNCCEPNGAPNSSYCNSNPDNCCRRDALGIPRGLLNANDCAAPVAPGTSCATSADCCGKPCVGDKCLGACVNQDGKCTTHADCCSGLPCVIATGETEGICGGSFLPDGGVGTGGNDAGTPPADGGTSGDAGTVPPSCALYGQTCTSNGDCCDGVPCSSGVCRYVIK